MAAELARGPSAAHAMTKRCMHAEWAMDIDSALDFEARMQAECMMTDDFERAYTAFVQKVKPEFRGD
jgi:enoyl-CoA hydratase/carnithine racemase